MNYRTHNDGRHIDINGTCLCGYVKVSYADLCRVFGTPTTGDAYKVDAEWILEFEDGIKATIYNYKDGRNYNGPEGMPTELITDWHIGGNDDETVRRVREILDANGVKEPKPLKFGKIEAEHWDDFSLNGRFLKDGSRLILEWPDGSVEEAVVKILTVKEANPLENSEHFHVTRLFVTTKVRGIETLVGLMLDDDVLAAWSGEE